MLHSHAIDLEALCIIPGQKCWVLYIDALVLDSAGSLLDAISLCTKAALSDTVTPAVTVHTLSHNLSHLNNNPRRYQNNHQVVSMHRWCRATGRTTRISTSVMTPSSASPSRTIMLGCACR
jgi:exosome complex RNA-binding protein Rrp42 (RNase PH superfamily)